MSATSKIEWTDATWNPLRGCDPIGPGCKNCYAMRMMARGLPGLNSPTTGNPFAVMTPSGPRWTGQVELIESQLEVPLHWKRPRRIFVNSISDTFHASVPDKDILSIFQVMAKCPRHTLIVLTKRGERAKEFLSSRRWRNFGHVADMGGDYHASIIPGEHRETDAPFLPNVWLGVSASTQADLDAQIEHLRATPAAVRFLSLEPLIADLGTIDLSGIGWVIVGGESGPGARPCQIEWIRSVVRQCREAGTKCFVKQAGSYPTVQACRQHHFDFGEGIGRKARFSAVDEMHPSTGLWRVHLKDRKGGDPAEWPEDLQVRELPGGAR